MRYLERQECFYSSDLFVVLIAGGVVFDSSYSMTILSPLPRPVLGNNKVEFIKL